MSDAKRLLEENLDLKEALEVAGDLICNELCGKHHRPECVKVQEALGSAESSDAEEDDFIDDEAL